jgi:hypothetical protein
MATNNAANQKNTGIQSLNSSGVFSGVTITGTANQVAVTNGNGISGNPTLALTSSIYVSGVSFNSGTNVLSAFTEGTWTPSISSTGSAPTGIVYTSQVGRYSQVGNGINIQCLVIMSAYTAGTGNATIITLPFTPAAVTNQNYMCQSAFNTVTFGAGVVWYNAMITQSSTSITFIGSVSATTVYTALSTDLVGSTNIALTGWFSIA